ncbi:MAG: 16S rRNA processing protein RimM [Alphaproteobacteria bacterium]|nr:ribosome maturation factor RimM [Alphaproteobacteria bacterium]TAD87455.1 MAG: 16S rRNA processing protein RimM [Alphaproteobacteria bacterium]
MAFGLDRPVIVARFAGAHGVRGLVRLRSFTAEPAAVLDYGPLSAADGRRFTLNRLIGESRGALIVAVAGIADRDAAERLTGLDLAIDRAALPAVEDEDEVYHTDLIGLVAERLDGAPLGRVVAVQDFGGGTLLELEDGSLLPFTRQVVPTIDLAGGRLVVEPPQPIIDPDATEQSQSQEVSP